MLLSVIPSHDVAQWILSAVRDLLSGTCLSGRPVAEEAVYIAVISVFAVLAGYILRVVILFIVRRIVAVRHTTVGDEILRRNLLTKCSHVIPPVVFLALIPFAFDSGSVTLVVIRRVVCVYLAIMFGVGLNSVIDFVWSDYNRRVNKQNHPLKGVMNVAKGVVWIVVTVVSVSVLADRSPMALLGGLGVFAAALMLVFKDSILGFVAGIQLSSNDMLRVGDWIVVPSTIANGVVTDVSLTVVKVQNWDNTIVMLPPYSLVSTSFQNWRGMYDSGVRQIERAVIIDNTSVVALDRTLSDFIGAKYAGMKDYISQRYGKEPVFNGGVAPVNGTADTNLGLFRAYMCQYLLAHPGISNDDNIIVRLLSPDANGTPLEIYCFTSTTDWLAYEAIRSQIFEHIAVSAPDFGLRIFNATYHGNIELSRKCS